MSKKLFLAPVLLLLLLLTSCEETTEVSKYDNWQSRNEAFTDSLYNVYTTQADHGGLDSIHLLMAPSRYIFYKKLPAVTELTEYVSDPTQRPLDQSSSVDVYYKGTNILGERFDGFYGDAPTVFDAPSTFTLVYGSIINGWWEVLQRMTLGERWEVYIPWAYGYGSSGTTGILGYSTLIFDMQLYRINNLSFTRAEGEEGEEGETSENRTTEMIQE